MNLFIIYFKIVHGSESLGEMASNTSQINNDFVDKLCHVLANIMEVVCQLLLLQCLFFFTLITQTSLKPGVFWRSSIHGIIGANPV